MQALTTTMVGTEEEEAEIPTDSHRPCKYPKIEARETWLAQRRTDQKVKRLGYVSPSMLEPQANIMTLGERPGSVPQPQVDCLAQWLPFLPT